MKAFILTEADFERLRLRLNQDPNRGLIAHDMEKRESFNAALRTLTFTIETWISEVQKP